MSDFVIEDNTLLEYIGPSDSDSVIIPEGVKSYKPNCLKNLDIKALTFPSSMDSIPNSLFSKCTALEKINISKNTKDIFFEAFVHLPSLTELNIEDGNPYFNSIDGVVYSSTPPYTLLFVPRGKKGSFYIKDGTTKIKRNALFNCKYITSLTLPNSLTDVTERALGALESLNEINIPSSLKDLDLSFYEGSPHLKDVNIDKDNPYFCASSGALYAKKENGKRLILVSKYRTGSFKLPLDITSISLDAFNDSGIEELVIPKGLDFASLYHTKDEVYNPCFGFCTKLRRLTFEDKNYPILLEWFSSLSYFDHTRITKHDLQRFIQSILPSQINANEKKLCLPYVCEELLSLVPFREEWKKDWLGYIKKKRNNSIKEIVENPNLLNVMIKYKLLDLSHTKDAIEIAQGQEMLDAVSILLEYENTNFSFEEIMKAKEEELFEDMDRDSLTYINKRYRWDYTDKCENSIKIIGYKGKEKDIVIPSHIDGKPVTQICAYAFSPNALRLKEMEKISRENIQTVSIPDTVETILEGAFFGCSKLYDVVMSKNVRETKEGFNGDIYQPDQDGVFGECISLKSVKLPEGMKEVPPFLFRGATKLEEVTLPSTIEVIGQQAFFQTKALKTINFPHSLKKIDEAAFFYCPSLKEVVINEEIEEICYTAFGHCNNLVMKGKGSRVIKEYAKLLDISYVEL